MIELQVEGMTCQHCAAAVTKAVRAVDGDARVQVELQSARVQVASRASVEQLVAAITDAGYAVTGTAPAGTGSTA